MSDYTPSTEWVRIMVGYGKKTAADRTLSADQARDEGYEWFDRWLASVQAEAWDEGRAAGWADRAPGVYPDEFHANPYEKGSDDER